MDNTSTPRHPIRVVAQRTGLTPATIRAWELRYDAVSFGSEILERMLQGLADRAEMLGGPPMVVCTLPGNGLGARR